MSFLFLCGLFFFSCKKRDVYLEGDTKILLIGNSFSKDAVGEYFAEMSKNNGERVVVAVLSIGGGSLEDHIEATNNKTKIDYIEFDEESHYNTLRLDLESALRRHQWTHVSVQQVSDKSGVYKSYHPYLRQLLAIIEKHTKASKILHQTWSYDQSSAANLEQYSGSSAIMFDSIENTTNLISKEYEIGLMPAGKAINHFRDLTDRFTLTRDGKHLNQYGKYIVAYTWYLSIFGEDRCRYYPDELQDEFLNIATTSVESTVK